jgi:hypothetical protein
MPAFMPENFDLMPPRGRYYQREIGRGQRLERIAFTVSLRFHQPAEQSNQPTGS